VKRWSVIGIGLVTVAAVVLGVLALTRDSREASAEPPTRQAAPPYRPGAGIQTGTYLAARTKGSPDAPITVLEASDFQCPYCRVFWEETLPLLQKEYIDTGKIKLVFLNLPLTSIHPNAAAAAQFAMCAAAQNRFWPVHDLLYQYQDQWAPLADPSSYFSGLAETAELDRAKLQECLQDPSIRDAIQLEAERNFRAGLRSTPSFVINGGRLDGAQPIGVWRPILDSIYAAKTDG
jgi:protein-disulfide isomerase